MIIPHVVMLDLKDYICPQFHVITMTTYLCLGYNYARIKLTLLDNHTSVSEGIIMVGHWKFECPVCVHVDIRSKYNNVRLAFILF